jgi:Cytochrome c7 and related cytochrome c
VEKAAYAGIPPTKTCINCHAQIWTNAELLEPVRQSWATGESVRWIRVHDLPDFVYFSHDIHVNKGIGCASCHGRVDEMPLMYQQNTLQMEWCLNCHRNPAVNLRPTSEIYNMAWAGPSSDKPVWCASNVTGGPTSQNVSCTTVDPAKGGPEVALLQAGPAGAAAMSAVSDAPSYHIVLNYEKFTSQMELGKYLTAQYHIRTPDQLSSCETCHR